MKHDSTVYRISENTLASAFDDGLIIYVDGRLVSLDPVGRTMWEAIVEHSNLSGALAALKQRFDCDESVLEKDLVDLLDQLVSFGALTVQGEDGDNGC